MISGLGHCEDTACAHLLSNPELVRLFRCSLHCDRLLCLYHLNAHNVYYEEEKKQNDVVFNELKTSLTLYQTIFEQHLQEYRQIVHQASTLLLHNTSTIVPIEQIRPVLERIQRAIAIFQQEKVIIKSEPISDAIEFNIESNFLKDISSIKKEINSPIRKDRASNRVVVRLKRIEYGLNAEHSRKSTDDPTIESTSCIPDEDVIDISKSPEPTDENQRKRNKRACISSSALSKKKKYEKTKKKTQKKIPLKRLQR